MKSEVLYEISGATGDIDFAPATVTLEVLQNVRTIISTLQGSVPLDREFGFPTGITDLPTGRAQAEFSAEVFRAVKDFEPRAEIKRVYFQQGDLGQVLPVITLEVKGGGQVA